MKNKKMIIIGSIILIMVVFLIFTLVSLNNNSSKNIYEFDFFTDYIPGATYSGEINLKTGKVLINVSRGCSLPVDECDKLDLEEEYTGKLNKKEREKVNGILEKTKYKDSLDLIIAMEYILEGDEICFEDGEETCREVGNDLLESLYSNVTKKKS